MIKNCIPIRNNTSILIKNARIDFLYISHKPRRSIPHAFMLDYVSCHDYIYIETEEPIDYTSMTSNIHTLIDDIPIYEKQKIIFKGCSINSMIFDSTRGDIDLHLDHSDVRCFIDQRKCRLIMDEETSQIKYHIIDLPNEKYRTNFDYMKISSLLYIIKVDDKYIPLELHREHKFKDSPISKFAYLAV